MEKERYELQEVFEDGSFHWYLRDNDTKLLEPLIDLHNCVDLLNQQNTKIKELEEQLSVVTMYHGCDILINELKQKNQQLKESKEHFKKVAENAVDLISMLNKELPRPQSKELNYKKCIDNAICLIKENQQLKRPQNQKAIEVLEDINKTVPVSKRTLY